jgi:hypothetical protein
MLCVREKAWLQVLVLSPFTAHVTQVGNNGLHRVLKVCRLSRYSVEDFVLESIKFMYGFKTRYLSRKFIFYPLSIVEHWEICSVISA